MTCGDANKTGNAAGSQLAHSKSAITVLLVEDNDADYLMVKRRFAEINQLATRSSSEFYREHFDLLHAPSLQDVSAAVGENRCDVVLLDLGLPDGDGLECLRSIHLTLPGLPVVILSGAGSNELALSAMKEGAQDYLVKGDISSRVLFRSIRYALERHRIQQALEEATNCKTRFLANMSHEIRTPLTAIIGFAEMLLAKDADARERQEATQSILRNGNLLLAVINDILDLSKIEAGKLEIERIECSPWTVLSDVVRTNQLKVASKGLPLNVEYQFPLPLQIKTDPLRLRQILGNLVGNAIKFTSEGSVSIHVSCEHESNLLVFRISDTGVGVNADEIAALFQPFTQSDPSTTRRFGGTGLGLAISLQYANALGGSIEVESEPEKGSIFTLRIATGDLHEAALTYSQNELPDEPLQAEVMEAPNLSGHVLLVEDCGDNQALASYLIRLTGAELTVVENGIEAVAAALARPFDLIFMDLQMPLMDGYEATRELRKHGYPGPIVALTASILQTHSSKSFSAGCDEILGKPYRRADLFSLLEKYLRRGAPKRRRRASEEADYADLEEVERLFRNNLPIKVQAIEEALLAQDWSALTTYAHRMSGAEMFGFPEIGSEAIVLKHFAQASEELQCEKVVRRMKRLVRIILDDETSTDALKSAH